MTLFAGRRLASRLRLRTSRTLRSFTVLSFAAVSCAASAHAVVVHGRVTDALGKPISGARVQLLEKGTVAGIGYSGADGTFEVRSGDAARFTLTALAPGYTPPAANEFYGGVMDDVQHNIVLSSATVPQAVSVSATAIPTPIPQLTAPVTVLPGELLSTHIGVVDTFRQSPGVFIAQSGQVGGVTSLFLRGGNSTANLVLIDGIPAEDVGGIFDYGSVSSTGISRIEIYRGPDSAIYGTDAGAGVVSIETPRGTTSRPVLNYSGDAGTLHTWRNEISLGGTASKLDYFGAFSRFDTSNALPNDRFHAATSTANLGYDFNGNTQLRLTIRNQDSATGLPGAHDFYGISNDARQSDQDLYAGLTLEHRSQNNWHNLVRYGIARKREQEKQFTPVGTPITFDFGFGPFTEYFGNIVTIRGANGYTATGQASFFQGNDDQSSNRDQLYFQSDWSNSPYFNVLFGFRYDNERGSFNDAQYFEHEVVKRPNFEYNLQFQGEVKGRFSYSLGGAIEKNHLYGIAGTPRIGLSWVPVRPSQRLLHGTRLRANAATGVQEPSLALEFSSLYSQLQAAGDTADIAQYHIGTQAAERSRTYDLGVDQNIWGEKLVLKAGYFHNIFDRQLEGVTGQSLQQYFGLNLPASDYVYSAYLNSLAYRAQGLEFEAQWQPTGRIFVRGGYTYLASIVLQSFASDAIAANQGTPTENPNLPGIAIGAESPLVGAHPFRRPPHTGFITAQYTRPKYTVLFQGAFASRSDDSTFLDGFDPNFGNSLLLPNHNLDFGYAKLDLGGTYAVRHNVTAFAQLGNLLNNQHIGPIGYPGLPLTVRAGLKLRLGGE